MPKYHYIVLICLSSLNTVNAAINSEDLVCLLYAAKQEEVGSAVLLQRSSGKSNPFTKQIAEGKMRITSDRLKSNVQQFIAAANTCTPKTADPETLKKLFNLVMGYDSNPLKVDELKVLLATRINPDLLYAGDATTSGGEGMTALMWAVDRGHLPFVEELVRSGANVNKQDANKGWSPLHFAAARGELEIAQYLIAQGAHKSIKNYMKPGETPYTLAERNGRKAMLPLLRL